MTNTDQIIKEFNEKFRNEPWYPDNWEPIENFIKQKLDQAIRSMNEEKFYKEVEKYLISKGWKPLVIGSINIEQGSLKYNFKLVINFTGKKIKKLFR